MKKTIKRIYIEGDYNDYRKRSYCCTKFEVINELPMFGTYDGKDVVKIEKIRTGSEQYSWENYIYYKITTYNEEWEDEEEFFVAIKKELEEDGKALN